MKKIIQRKLSLEQTYTVLSIVHKSIMDGDACGCDNCGQLIANVANVKGEDSVVYSIGTDCLETFLLNNKLFSGESIELYSKAKRSIPKAISISKAVKEFLDNNKFIDTVNIEYWEKYNTYVSAYYLAGGKGRWNDSWRYKDGDINLLMDTLRSTNKGITFNLKLI